MRLPPYEYPYPLRRPRNPNYQLTTGWSQTLANKTASILQKEMVISTVSKVSQIDVG